MLPRSSVRFAFYEQLGFRADRHRPVVLRSVGHGCTARVAASCFCGRSAPSMRVQAFLFYTVHTGPSGIAREPAGERESPSPRSSGHLTTAQRNRKPRSIPTATTSRSPIGAMPSKKPGRSVWPKRKRRLKRDDGNGWRTRSPGSEEEFGRQAQAIGQSLWGQQRIFALAQLRVVEVEAQREQVDRDAASEKELSRKLLLARSSTVVLPSDLSIRDEVAALPSVLRGLAPRHRRRPAPMRVAESSPALPRHRRRHDPR